MNLPVVYRVDQAARLLGCCKETIERRIKSGKLKAKRNGRQVVILGEDLEKFVRGLPDYLRPGTIRFRRRKAARPQAVPPEEGA